MDKNIKLINFINLSLEEKKIVLSWRNDTLIREWMFQKNEISLLEHLSFIEKLKVRKDALYFIVKENEENIGVIDFVNINSKSVHMGIYANPVLKGKGGILMKSVIEYAFGKLKVDKIISEVYLENFKAQKLYLKYGFKETHRRMMNEVEVISMRLENEDR